MQNPIVKITLSKLSIQKAAKERQVKRLTL